MSEENSVPSPDDLPASPSWSFESLGKLEDKNWENEEKLRGVESTNKIRALTTFGWIVPTFMIGFSAIFGCGILCWTWHYLTPDSLHWLTAEQLSKIQSIIFSGTLGGLVATYAKQTFLNENNA